MQIKSGLITHTVETIADSERQDFRRGVVVMERGGSIADWWTDLINYVVDNEYDQFADMVY